MKNTVIATLLSTISLATYAQQTITELHSNGNKQFEGTVVTAPYEQGAHFYVPTQNNKSAADVAVSVGDNVAIKDGKWTHYFENGKVANVAYFKKGFKTGTWISYYPDGKISSEENFETGKAVYFFQNGQKFQEGNLNNDGLKHGYWKGWHENGQLNYEGDYVNGLGSKNVKWFNNKGEPIIR